jgi:signal transduction histidine kinase
LALPLRTPEVVMGALCLVRSTNRPFTEPDVAMARTFGDQAASALRIGDLREARERLRVLEDRERIARDLHDSVIQDLFAVGMALDAVQPLITSAEASERVTATIDQLDSTIKVIRSSIFELEAADMGVRTSDLVRHAVDNRAEQLGFTPRLEVDGDPDDIPIGVLDHVLAVLSESLSNVVRHSGARAAEVRLAISPTGSVTLAVTDDGGGFDPQRVPRGRGLDNMHRRSALLGGTLQIARPAGGQGTRVMLSAPAPTPGTSEYSDQVVAWPD